MTEISEGQMSKGLQDRIRALPREIVPPDDAWSEIRVEIDHRLSVSRGPVPVPGARLTATQFPKPVFLAAAAMLLVVASSLVTIAVMRDTTLRRASSSETGSESPRSASGPSTFAEFASVENDYIGSVNQLSAVLESERTTLSPETISKLKKSLDVIDSAILEARRALAADPVNKAIIEMLNTSYTQKLDLLKRTTEMGRT